MSHKHEAHLDTVKLMQATRWHIFTS